MKTRTLLFVAAGLATIAADWPQFRGPDRTEISAETGLLKTWPKEGPRLLWKYDQSGIGYSGPAVVGNRLFCMGGDGANDFVFCLDTQTGKRLWQTNIGTYYKNGYGDGPRCTPTTDGDVLYALGGGGNIACLDLATGKPRWPAPVSMQKDLRGQMMSGWGYSESPLVDGNQLVVSPGGAQGTLAALDKKTGKVIWRSKGLTDAATYASIIAAEVGGVRQYIQSTYTKSEGGIVGVSAKDGQLLWRVPREGWRTAVVPTPIFHNNHVFVSAGYGAGCDLVKLTPAGKGTRAERVYTNKNMVNHHGGVVLWKDHLYGNSDGRGWVCMDFLSGKIVWEEKGKLGGKGSLTCADGHFYCLREVDGTVAMIEATPTGWSEKGRFTIQRDPNRQQVNNANNVWTHPVVANGRLYLRDCNLLYCYDLRGGTASAQ